MKQSLHRTAYSIFGTLFLGFLFFSFSGNAPNGYTGAPGESLCTTCHGGSNSQGLDGDIQITGVPANIIPNTTYPLSVIVSNPNGLSMTAGFSMTAIDAAGNKVGSLANPSTGAAIATGNRDYFEHNPAQTYAANRTVTWTVDWTAPPNASPDPVTFYAAGNITDSNTGTNTSNDLIVTTTATGMISSGQVASDLTVSNLVGWDASYTPGEVVFFDFDINNIGNDIANGDYNIMSYLSTDPFFDASDISVGDLVTGNTGIGTIPGVVGAISIPANLPPGNYYLIIVIDALAAINELDENNNVLVSPLAASIQPTAQLVSSWSVIDVSCFGGTNGQATAMITGGTPPYNYAWQNGGMTQTISGLAAGNYPFTITDSNGNSTSNAATVIQPTVIAATVTTTNVQCAGDVTGSASISTNGGTPPYNIVWPGGTNSNLAVGNYIVTITDNNGCSAMESFSIAAVDNTPPVVVLDQSVVIPLGANGQASVASDIFNSMSFDNCFGTLTYSAAQVNFTCADLGSQTINVVVSDANGNATTSTAQATIIDNIDPSIVCPAAITVTGEQVVNYNTPTVSDNCTTNINPSLIAGLPSGSFFQFGTSTITFQATDNSGNSSSCNFNVTVQGSVIQSNMSATNVSCNGGNDGTATISASGGTPPYMYAWQNGMTTSTITNLPAGNYPVTVTDVNGTAINNSVVVTEPAALVAAVTTTDVQCVGDMTGSANIAVSGGTLPYTIAWPNGSSMNLGVGNFSVTVTDNNNCITIENYTISANDNTPPNVVLDQTTFVSLDANGQASISADIFDDNSSDNCGGNLTFVASQVNFSCADLGTQNINLVVSDNSNNSTTVTAVATVVDNLAPTITCSTVTTIGCDQVVEYGLPTVTDNCTQNIIPALVSGLPSGSQFPIGLTTITFEAVDASNNVSTCFFDINVTGSDLMAATTATSASCLGGADGTATATPAGGVPPFAYSWSNMATTPTINNLIAGTYTVTVMDQSGCEVISSVDVGEPTQLVVAIDLVSDDTGSDNGSIFITASGGTPGYSYNWFNENNVLISTAEDPQDLIAGIYNAVIMDANGCTITSPQIQITTVVDVEEIELENAIQIFPNPTSGLLTINIDLNIQKENAALQILDQNGKLVYNNLQFESLNQVINLNDLQNGLYWFKFIVEEKVVVRKVVIAK